MPVSAALRMVSAMTDPATIIAGMSEAMLKKMLHALGRPERPEQTGSTYRNYYCCAADGETSREFAASGLWELTGHINNGRDAIWSVNERGMAAVRDALRERG